MKPTLFEIYIDGKKQDQFANQIDQQAHLEDNILDLIINLSLKLQFWGRNVRSFHATR